MHENRLRVVIEKANILQQKLLKIIPDATF